MIEKDATGNPLAFIGPKHDGLVKGASEGKGASSAWGGGGGGSVEASDKPASTEASDKPAGESVTPESAPEKSPVEILVDEFKVTKEEAEAAYKLNDENLDDAREFLKPQAEGEGEAGNVFDFDWCGGRCVWQAHSPRLQENSKLLAKKVKVGHNTLPINT